MGVNSSTANSYGNCMGSMSKFRAIMQELEESNRELDDAMTRLDEAMMAMESAIPESWKTRGESLSVEEALD